MILISIEMRYNFEHKFCFKLATDFVSFEIDSKRNDPKKKEEIKRNHAGSAKKKTPNINVNFDRKKRLIGGTKTQL